MLHYVIVYSQSKSICKAVAMTCGHLDITWRNNKTSHMNTWIGLKPESCKRRLGTGSCFALILVVIWLFLTFIKVLSWVPSSPEFKQKLEGEMASESGVSEMAFEDLRSTVTVLHANLDQAFLIFMGCLIFCEYFFISLTHLVEHIQRFHWDEWILSSNFIFTSVTLSHS